MLAKETLDFLKKLEKNNNREWFLKNKPAFEAANDNIAAFTGSLIALIGKFDTDVAGIDPKTCVFRIYRDIRFSKDKSPYKTNLGAYIAPGGRKSTQPGYYFHIQPGQCFFAGGKHIPDGPELQKIRTAIDKDLVGFRKIVEKKSYRDMFGELRGDRLKSAPKGFDPECPAVEFLKLKEYMAWVEFPSDRSVTAPGFSKITCEDRKRDVPADLVSAKGLEVTGAASILACNTHSSGVT